MTPMLRGTDAQRAELKRRVTDALRDVGGNLTRAAAQLGVDVATLRRYLPRLGLDAAVDRMRPDRGKRRRVGRVAGRRGGRPPA